MIRIAQMWQLVRVAVGAVSSRAGSAAGGARSVAGDLKDNDVGFDRQDALNMGQRGNSLADQGGEFMVIGKSIDMMIEGVPGSSARDQSRAKTDKLQEMKHYGLHRHFTGGPSVAMYLHSAQTSHTHLQPLEHLWSAEPLQRPPSAV